MRKSFKERVYGRVVDFAPSYKSSGYMKGIAKVVLNCFCWLCSRAVYLGKHFR